jgi:hypothetical protein
LNPPVYVDINKLIAMLEALIPKYQPCAGDNRNLKRE